VVVDPDRVAGVAAAAKAGADIAILDDGFQHRRLARDLDLVLLSPAHPLPPHLLPRGPFREPVGALRRADRVIVTAKGPEELAEAQAIADGLAALPGTPPVALFPLRAGDWRSLNGAVSPAPGGRPLVVTSVAAPEAFRRSVEGRIGGPVEHLEFGDHHEFTESDAIAIRETAAGTWVATTEKDAVKLTSLWELLPEVRVLPLVPEPPAGLEDELIGALEERLRARERS
jgi:tetraacyldisaccharide 4'-kinase